MGADSIPDVRLLKQIAGGNAEAFGALFRRRQGDVYRFALHMTGRPAVAEDVTQDTFLAVMRDAGRYDPARATVIAWLCGIARNHVLRRFERERPLQALDLDEEAPPGDGPQALHDVLGELTRAEEAGAVREAVMTLPVRYREAVALCDLQELSYADAAAALGCAVGTVRSRLHRGRALLAAKLSALEPQRTRTSDAAREPADTSASDRPMEFRRAARAVRRLA